MKNKIVIIFGVIFLTFLIPIISASNENHFAVNWNNPQNLYDGDINTYANFKGGQAIYYVNYTKPTNSIGAVWNVIAKNAGAEDQSQYIDLSSCWNKFSNKLVLKIELSGSPRMYLSCSDGNNFRPLAEVYGTYLVYDSSITWKQKVCNSKWYCTNWSKCKNGQETRKCTDLNNCNKNIPELKKSCRR